VETFCYLSSRVISFAGCGLVIGGIAEHKPWAVITNQLVCVQVEDGRESMQLW
jgi:hypothetical protein